MRLIANYYTLYLCSFLIILLSVLPLSSGSGAEGYTDKILHFINYAILAFIAVNAFSYKTRPRLTAFWYAFILGLLLEEIQYFLPYRSFELLDIAANAIGAGLGCLVLASAKRLVYE